jgi:prolyl oligopeptidase PreP (S9A serine peptidase family)
MARRTPAVLLVAAENDARVDPLHARKMAARLQAATSADRPVLLRLEQRAGGGAGQPADEVLEELTACWAFICRSWAFRRAGSSCQAHVDLCSSFVDVAAGAT